MSDENVFKIMVIDDNASIHHDFIKILKTVPTNNFDSAYSKLFQEDPESLKLPKFEIDNASQGAEAIEKIKENLKKNIHYALAFVDIRMPPGWDGIETIKRIWALDKDIQVVICTAYSDYSWEETVAHLGKKDNLLILKKPFDNVSVRQLACALTAKWELAEKARRYTFTLKQQVADQTLSLQKSLSLLKSTFESSSDGILVVSNEREIIDYNQKIVDLLDIPRYVLETKSESQLFKHLKEKLEDEEKLLATIEELHQGSNEISINVIKLKNGKIFECYSQPHRLNNKIIGYILDFRDITKRAKLEKELLYQATHDSLTGLGNRLTLIDQMKHAISLSEKNHSQFAVVFIDFDRFKLINDSLSHLVGDELLQKASARLLSKIRSEDTLVRLGGDEFVIIFMNINDEKNIQEKVEKLIATFHEPFEVGERNVTITASFGISIYPKDGKTTDILLRNADAAMYRAKAKKGNKLKFYKPEMNTRDLAELDHEIELRHAVENNEFFLVYQPQIDLVTENLVALEALIRWQHPTKGVLLPLDFIPLAEKIGLIIPIGEWALRTACAQNKAWQDQGLPPIRVAVNVSEQQFRQHDLIKMIKQILDETKLRPEYLEIEVTENVILTSERNMRQIGELKKLGVMIALDDFGTGYSSLSYLNKLPLDRLKIDSSFIHHIHSSTDDEVIIRAVIAIAKNLDLKVLAEGVETLDQLNFLKKNQCGDVQGFYFSKPLLKKEAEHYLKNPTKIPEMIAIALKEKK